MFFLLPIYLLFLSLSGASYICNLLKTTDTLKNIKLDHNYIRDDGMFSVCEGLQHNHTLTSLIVTFCHFSVKGTVTHKM